jgi:hypothetical protein
MAYVHRRFIALRTGRASRALRARPIGYRGIQHKRCEVGKTVVLKACPRFDLKIAYGIVFIRVLSDYAPQHGPDVFTT